MEKIGIFGFGKMGRAIAQSLSSKGFAVLAYGRKTDALKGVEPVESLSALSSCDAIIICVKPKDAQISLRELRAAIPSLPLVISIMAGKPLSFIESELGSNRVIRAMPNLAARHKASANGFCLAKGASSKDKSLAERLFSSFGIFVELKEEQLDAFTALGGSGPGYFFYFAKALSNAGVAAGLSEKEAREVARQVLIGAAKIAENSEESFEALVSQVATPGGTTEAALAEFENSKLGEIARRAVEKAKLRSKELAKK